MAVITPRQPRFAVENGGGNDLAQPQPQNPSNVGGGNNLGGIGGGGQPNAFRTPAGAGTAMTALEHVMEGNEGHPGRVKKEYTWQNTLEGDKWESINDIILAQSPLFRAYTMVQPGSTTIKVVHSLAKYYGEDETAAELHGKVLGFHEDIRPPKPVVLPPQKTFKWGDVNICTDEIG